MTYDPNRLLAEARRALAERPWRGAEEVCRAIGASRDTLARTLRDRGTSFRLLRAQAVAALAPAPVGQASACVAAGGSRQPRAPPAGAVPPCGRAA